MPSPFERLLQVMQEAMEDSYYQGVKGQPAPSQDQVARAAWKVISVAAQEVGRNA